MINPFKEINWKPSDAEIRSFAKTLMFGFIIIGAVFYLIDILKNGLPGNNIILLVPTSIGVILFLFSVSAPRIGLIFYYLWFFVSALIGIVVSNLALVLFYYLFFSPFAVILRLFTGRDPLRLKKTNKVGSGWIDYKKHKDLKRYFRQY